MKTTETKLVWVTPTGRGKYHGDGCNFLVDRPDYQQAEHEQIPLKEAKRTREPCRRCERQERL